MTATEQPDKTFADSLRVFLPILRWLPAYDRAWLRPDLLAGLTLAAFTIPESMAYADLAGLPPQYGLYASLAAPLLYLLFGYHLNISGRRSPAFVKSRTSLAANPVLRRCLFGASRQLIIGPISAAPSSSTWRSKISWSRR